MAALAAILKYAPGQSRDSDGRFASGSGDETGSGAPRPGEKFTVYRLGDSSGSLTNRNAGNANAVARHIARTQNIDAPQGRGGSGDTVTAREVTVGAKGFGSYALYNAGTGQRSTQVGRNASSNQVNYSFPKGSDYTSRLLGSVKLSTLGDFDEMGSNKGAEVIRAAFSPRVGKVDLAKLLKYAPGQARDSDGRFASGDADDATDASHYPRAEPGSLTPSQRNVETRFANSLASSPSNAMKEYANLDGTAGGKILNTDLVRELSADYRNDRSSLSPAVHEPASQLTKDMYAQMLAEKPVTNTVLFTAGGAGSGKSSGIKQTPGMAAIEAAADIVYDTNLNKFGSARQKIQQALDSGRNVQIAYVARDPIESLVQGALPRAMGSSGGRTVPLVEHAATHTGSATAIQELAAYYAGDSRVQIHYIDNTHGRGGAKLGDASLPKSLDFSNLHQRLETALKGEYDAGRISTRVYEGTKGSFDSRGP
jgi:hypothetical protein